MFKRCQQILFLFLLLPLLGWSSLITGIDSFNLVVKDAAVSSAFFQNVLDFKWQAEQVIGTQRVISLTLGDAKIHLIQHLEGQGKPYPADFTSNDPLFQHFAIVVSDMGKAYERLNSFGVEAISDGPQRLPDWNKNAGGIEAFYFKDPDGHPLEIISYPPGKGNPKWHRENPPLFQGIDHTAIFVADTDQSLKFYRDYLGFKVVGQSENYGVEQEKLSGVPGARLRITALSTGEGPGIELLQYLQPSIEIKKQAGTPTDLWYTIVHLKADRFPQSLPIHTRDPDGHALTITIQPEKTE